VVAAGKPFRCAKSLVVAVASATGTLQFKRYPYLYGTKLQQMMDDDADPTTSVEV
jgi:hypothetical protein